MNKLTKWVRRTEEAEQGFTLIELMVVVLIIGILVAIAIPTFLGARNSAENRAAESSVRNAFTSAKVFFTNNNTYSGIDVTSLMASEPSLTFKSGGVGTTPTAGAGDPNTVFVTTSGTSSPSWVCLSAQSKTGNYYSMFDDDYGNTLYASSTSGTQADPCTGLTDTSTGTGANAKVTWGAGATKSGGSTVAGGW